MGSERSPAQSAPDDRVAARLDELVGLAQATNPVTPPRGVMMPAEMPAEQVARWLVPSLDLVRQVFGEASEYSRGLERCALEKRMVAAGNVRAARGILLAARDAYAAGWARDLRELMAGEVFADLLEMAEHLMEEDGGYHLPAAAVAGAVLEDALRRLCCSRGVTWPGDSSISKLNTELYKLGAYDKLEHAKVDGWGKLRNKVDHGDFASPSDVDPKDVRRMVEGIRDFLTKHLT